MKELDELVQCKACMKKEKKKENMIQKLKEQDQAYGKKVYKEPRKVG